MQFLQDLYTQSFRPEYRLIIAFILAIIVNAYATPVILTIAKAKKIFDIPNQRGSHKSAVATLGGLGIYFSIVTVGLSFINTSGLTRGGSLSSLTSLPAIIAAFTIIFFVGLKDDLLNISPYKKIVAEIIALLILTMIGELRLFNLQGIFGFHEIRFSVSILLSVFAGVVIINSFNLIDGVDGLASSIAMLGCTVFGSYFLKGGEWEYAILSFTIVGALIPFFVYNVFGKENKIFMGDAGSLLLGLAMTALVFRFNEMSSVFAFRNHFIAGPALFSFAVLIIPLFDTLRVFAVRIYRGHSPFAADRRHIHHVLLDLGFTHLQTTLILIVFNLLFIGMAYFLGFLGNSNLVFSIIIIASIMSGIAMRRNRLKMIAKQKADSE